MKNQKMKMKGRHGFMVNRIEKRRAGKYEIIHSINIGGREVVFGIANDLDSNINHEDKYLCSYCKNNWLFEQYEESMVSNKYLEIMQIFCERVQKQIEIVKQEQFSVKVPMELIVAEQCYPNDYKRSILGKVMVLKPQVLSLEYQNAVNQIWIVTGGFGAEGNSRGQACYSKNLYSGEKARWERSDFIGEIKKEHIPEWAEKQLDEIHNEADDEMEM